MIGDSRMAAELLGQQQVNFALAAVFDDVASMLERMGFAIIRNPLPLMYVDDEVRKERQWYYATANNALVEIKSETDKTVWLPTYGYGNWQELQKTDEANKKVWESLGFKVVLLTDYHPLAEYSGAAHCIKKYIRRGKV